MPIVISGCIGPRGDGYVPDTAMSEREAEDYHRMQIETLADTAADLVTAITMNYVEESVGIARAASKRTYPSSSPSQYRQMGISRQVSHQGMLSTKLTVPRRDIPPTS
jgi:S-methylmethionine-dependent homocysteine/selenocysteine methylase